MTWANCIMESSEARVAPINGERVTLSVRRLEKSIAFYRHVFDFRLVADARHERNPCVIMTAPGQCCLTLREEKRLNNESPADAAWRGRRRLRLSVGDLDEARASLWDNGVPLARGTREPGEGRHARRSLFVDDPDGHRIELVKSVESGTS